MLSINSSFMWAENNNGNMSQSSRNAIRFIYLLWIYMSMNCALA